MTVQSFSFIQLHSINIFARRDLQEHTVSKVGTITTFSAAITNFLCLGRSAWNTFSLGVDEVLTPLSTTLSDKNVKSGEVCTCMHQSHRIKRSQHSCPWQMNASTTKRHPAGAIHEDGMWLRLWLHERKVIYTRNFTRNGELQRPRLECRRIRRNQFLVKPWFILSALK